MTNLKNDVYDSLFKKFYIISETLILTLNELHKICELCLLSVYERRITEVSATMCIENILCGHNKS